jgi:N-acetylmuramoyl-L-alanine amidase
LIVALWTLTPAVGSADSLRAWRTRAEREDAALRADEDRLRYRHNIIHVIKLWQSAVKRAEGAERVELLEREAEAWALLAHWSGRTDDARRAEAEREEAAAARSAQRAAARGSTSGSDEAPEDAVAGVEALASDLEAALARRPPDIDLARRFGPDAPCVRASRDPLAVHTIVVDPGHGGDDEGAENRDGMFEKHVNLAIAAELAMRLEGFCVVMTRTDDTFVSLADRVRIANSVGADLFVSVHANGSPRRDFHGVETYVLDTDARRYAPRLRQREADLHGEAPPPGRDPHWDRDLRLLLADLAMRGATRDARRLAERVQSSLVERLRERHPDTKDLGVKSALFYVLLGARMPSILVESGFMTHPEEGRRMAQPAHREQVARGIADGVRAFAADRAHRAPGPGPVVATAD